MCIQQVLEECNKAGDMLMRVRHYCCIAR